MKRMLLHTPYAAAVGSGLLFGFAFPPYSLGFLAWFGFVPLLLRLAGGISWRATIAESITTCAVATLIAGYWTILHPIASARNAAMAGLVALAITGSIPFWLFGFGYRRASLSLQFGLLLGSAGLIEFAQFHTQIGFPWLSAGNTQATLSPLNQLASFVGTPGLSLWVYLSNVLISSVILSRAGPLRRATGLAFVLFLVGSFALSYSRLLSERRVVGEHDVLAVQPALSTDAWSDIKDVTRPDSLIAISQTGSGRSPELIVWPETTLPVLAPVDTPDAGYARLLAFIDSMDVPLLTGAVIEKRPTEEGAGDYYNSAVIFSPFVGITARYDKRILVPFAERVPYVEQIPRLMGLAVASGGVAGYAAGTAPGRLQYDGVPIGIMICFESVFGQAARDAEPEGVSFFVILTQDGWWGNTSGYRQHFAFNRLRAIETGRAVVQVTVSGITGLLLPDGSTAYETEWMERATRFMRIPEYAGSTAYARFGDLPVLLFSLFLFCAGAGLHLFVSTSNRTTA